MLRRGLSSSRWVVLIAVIGTLIASIALLVYEAIVVIETAIEAIGDGTLSPKAAKALAVGMIEAVDVFLIAIALYITSLGLYVLFVDDSLPMPKWFEIHDLEDLKANLASVVIAVLAVLFLREAVSGRRPRHSRVRSCARARHRFADLLPEEETVRNAPHAKMKPTLTTGEAWQ